MSNEGTFISYLINYESKHNIRNTKKGEKKERNKNPKYLENNSIFNVKEAGTFLANLAPFYSIPCP